MVWNAISFLFPVLLEMYEDQNVSTMTYELFGHLNFDLDVCGIVDLQTIKTAVNYVSH